MLKAANITYSLILSCLCGLFHDPLNVLDVQLFVDLLEHLVALLQSVQHRHLH